VCVEVTGQNGQVYLKFTVAGITLLNTAMGCKFLNYIFD